MKIRRIILLTLASLALSACSGKKSSNPRGNMSTNPVYPGGGGIGGNSSMGECTRTVTNGLAIAAQASTHYSYYGTMDKDKALINITQAPSEITNSNTHSIKFYRWKELQEGQAQVNETPTTFYFKHKSTGQLSAGMTELNKNSIDQTIGNNNLTSVTANNFFNHFYILLTGVDYQWQAVTLALYEGAGEALTSAEVLLPPFYADPNYYNQVTNSVHLESLHPFKQYVGSNTNYNYKQMSDSICYEMLGQRNVASEQSLWTQFTSSLAGVLQSVRGFLSHFFGL